MDILSERLKEERQKQNLTQKEVADKLHVDRVTYTNWELGKHKPDLDQIKEIADIFKTSVDYLIGRY
jgi:transcriptional regulator with XRE-family HTH domain